MILVFKTPNLFKYENDLEEALFNIYSNALKQFFIYVDNAIYAIIKAMARDQVWIIKTTLSIAGIALAYAFLYINPLIMAFIMLSLANMVSTVIYTSKETIKFTLFSTILIFLLFSIPGPMLALAAAAAAIVGSFNPNRAKYFVNAASLLVASMGAIYIYGFHEITIAAILAAGLSFEILNSITLLAGISYFGKERLRTLYTSWKGTWAFGLIAPISALFMIYLSPLPIGLGILAILFTLLSKPRYVTGRFWIHGRWFHASRVTGKTSSIAVA